MNDVQSGCLQYFVIIADKKNKNKFLALLGDHGARAVETVYGQGSMSPSAIAAAFGFEASQGKVMISCLLKCDEAKRLIDILYNDYKFNKPNTGIAFSISVEGLAF